MLSDEAQDAIYAKCLIEVRNEPCILYGHGPQQKCLFYDGAWRSVCLSCGKINMDGIWTKGKDLK